MTRSFQWKDSARDYITKISTCELVDSIGRPCWPDEYIETLEQYTKLLFDMNQVPEKPIQDLKDLEMQWVRFKYNLRQYCSNLLKEIDKESKQE